MYQRSVIDGLTGNYDHTWGPGDARKLRMHFQTTSEAFFDCMAKKGHTRVFRLIDDEIDNDFAASRKYEENIYKWIRQVYRESRGSELPGTVNPTVLENVFRQQSKPWNDIATQHIAKIHTIVERFNEAIFQETFYEDTLRDKVENRNKVSVRKANEDATAQLALILADERAGILQTLRLQNGHNYIVNLKSLVSTAHLSNEDQVVNDIHDILKAYYKVALKRFTDNVVVQVVERYYLGPEGPVKSISAEYIGGLSDTDLAHLAVENYATPFSRNEINARLERLEKALAIAEKERS